MAAGLFNFIINASSWLSTIISAMAGSMLSGNPLNSYILAAYLYEEGVSLVAVTAFMITWVTVGIAQAPVEKEYFGWKFTIFRNILFFLMAIIASILVTIIYKGII